MRMETMLELQHKMKIIFLYFLMYYLTILIFFVKPGAE